MEVTFKELREKSAILEIAAQAFEAGDFLKVFEFLRLFSYKKKHVTVIQLLNIGNK